MTRGGFSAEDYLRDSLAGVYDSDGGKQSRVALLPCTICQELDLARITSVAVDEPQVYLELAIVLRKDRYLSFAARRWLDFAGTYLGSNCTRVEERTV